MGGLHISSLHLYQQQHYISLLFFLGQCNFTIKCLHCLLSSPCVYHSLTVFFFVLSHFEVEQNFTCAVESDASTLWVIEPRRFSSHSSSLCVSSNMKNLHAFALEYMEAFYPLILIVIAYIFIKLHNHNFRPSY